MAKQRAARQSKVPADELKIQADIDALNERTKNRDKTAAEKEQFSKLKKALGALRFIRIGKQRAIKIVAAVRNLGNLSGAQYVRTPEQVKKLSAQIRAEVDAMEQSLSAVKKEKAAIGIEL